MVFNSLYESSMGKGDFALADLLFILVYVHPIPSFFHITTLSHLHSYSTWQYETPFPSSTYFLVTLFYPLVFPFSPH